MSQTVETADTSSFHTPSAKAKFLFPPDQNINEAHMSLKITGLLTILPDSGNQTVSDDTRRQRDALERTPDFIATHLADPITLDEMARQAHFSPFCFLRMFKAQTGVTPLSYRENQPES